MPKINEQEHNKPIGSSVGYKDLHGKIYYDLDWQLIQDLANLLYTNKVENGGKYTRENWKKDLTISALEDALDRHYLKYKLGQTDEEHDLAIVANIMMLRYLKRKNGLPDTKIQKDKLCSM